jgi:hypothetical protein
MRTTSPLIALTLALALGAPVAAQGQGPGRAGASYPRPGLDAASGPVAAPIVSTSTVGVPPVRPDRWGSKVGGRWWGGANAPGGWPAYRRPVRGMVVPGYWNSPRFGVSDWAVYRLPQPPVGYRWTRYYDDAVLIDPRGAVYDSVHDVDWDGAGGRAMPVAIRRRRRRSGVTTGWAARRSARSPGRRGQSGGGTRGPAGRDADRRGRRRGGGLCHRPGRGSAASDAAGP